MTSEPVKISPMRAPESPLAPFVDLDRGRARFSVRAATPTALPPVDGLLAGAAEADITPPPGLPKAGYSSNAHDGNGFRTRLRARVLHLRSGTTSLAWVQCDLLGGSSVLQHLVARAVAERTDIGLAGLLVGATHTHAGPGQFLGTDFYNRFASNRGGFDPAWTQFLIDQVADAVVRAHDTRGPARIAVGRTEVWGLTRNRSLDPHVHNDTVSDKRRDPQRKWVSVNPWLHMVRVDSLAPDGATTPLAATVAFSVHGTGVSMKAHEYNADLWAYLVGELSDRIERAHGQRAVVGAVECTHADVAPALRPGGAGHVEARRVGAGIGAEAFDLHQRLGADLVDGLPLAAGFHEIDLDQAGDRSIDGIDLPDRPGVGAALVAGAHENLTPVVHRIPPFRAGSPKPGAAGPHGEKWVLGTRWLQPLIIPKRAFPRVIPLQVLRIGPMAVVGLPFEITVETGRRLEAAALGAAGPQGTASALEWAVVASVSNEYSGYVATAEEYRRQFYEGGHTLYGPRTQRFLSAHVARLTASTLAAGTVSEPVPERSWDLKIHRYLPRPTSTRVGRAALTSPKFHDPTASEDGYWQFEWADLAPGDLVWHQPMVAVEVSDDRGRTWTRIDDDQGWHVEVTHLAPQAGDHGGHRYRTRWYQPSFRADRLHRFALLPNNGQPALTSPPFD